MYNKISNKILSWLFPTPKETKQDNKLKVIKEYFLFVNEIPYDEYRIEFCGKNEVQIYLIFYSWQEVIRNVGKERYIKEDMSNMFPYTFFVSCLVSSTQ